MSIRTALVCLNEVADKNLDQMIAAAKYLNVKNDVHIIGQFVIPAVDIYPSAGMGVATQIDESHRDFFLKEADGIKERFSTAMEKENISWEWDQPASPTSFIADGIIERAMTCDLVVVPQTRVDNDSGIESEMAERVVMEVGRPVLIIPAYGKLKPFGHRPVVAWNSTRESARAVFDAVQLFNKDADVRLSWLNAHKDHADMDLPGAELATVLARHDLKVTAEAIPTSGSPVAEALLSHAADVNADLLVMGAYGHSRLREFVFGGVTHTLLESMTVPVLMSQ